jgi:PAP2 superfamily
MRFANAEIFVIKLIFTLVALIVGLGWAKGIKIEYLSFILAIGICLFFVAIGQFYRRVRIDESIAASATVIGLGFIVSQFAVALNYVYLPYSFFGFDQKLAAADAFFGFVWSDFVTAVAPHQQLVDVLRTIYSSSFSQVMVVILALGVASKINNLHSYLISLTLGLLICISIWALFPSSSPVGFQPLSVEIAKQLNLALNPETGALLRRFAVEGISSYPPKELAGMIGFPSFHTVVLATTVYAARGSRLVFWPLAIWNLGMIPGILIHGAHNLVDVFGGLTVAAFCIYCAKRVMADEKVRQPILPTSAAGALRSPAQQ